MQLLQASPEDNLHEFEFESPRGWIARNALQKGPSEAASVQVWNHLRPPLEALTSPIPVLMA